MDRLTLMTPRLELRLQSPEEVLGWVESLPAAVRVEISPRWLAQVRQTEPGDPWLLGFVIHAQGIGIPVGQCGFKGPPTDGVVEIAYGIDEEHRGKGLATEAARALRDFALAADCVFCVIAHTKHENMASMRVLEKSGFQCVGEVFDPEDGQVLRWECRKN